jgi:hypothetical protein
VAHGVGIVAHRKSSPSRLAAFIDLVDEFAANRRVNWVASMLPGIIGIAGMLLFGWGMTVCVLLMQRSTPVGIYNVVKQCRETNAG